MIRRYQVGDSLLRYALTEPRDFAYWLRGRIACRVFNRHHPTCEGRADHRPLPHWPEGDA